MTSRQQYQKLYRNSWCQQSRQYEPPRRRYTIYVGQKGEDARQVSEPCRSEAAAWKSALDALKKETVK